MDFFAYSAYYTQENATDTQWITNYQSVGFNAVMLNGNVALGFEEKPFAGTACQQAMAAAYAQGIDKIIIQDKALAEICAYDYETLSSSSFSNGIGLKEFVRRKMSRYAEEDGFYGVVLYDEPKYGQMKSTGLVYKTVKEVAKEEFGVDVYIHVNMLPITSAIYTSFGFPDELSYAEAYESYLTTFLEEAGGRGAVDELCMDPYFFRGTDENPRLYAGVYANVQIFANVCKEYGVTPTVVLQAFAENNASGTPNYAPVGLEEMRMEIATYMGFGVKNFAYYKYAPYLPTASSSGYLENSTFVDENGKTTAVYEAGKKVIEETKAIEKILLNYAYQGANVYVAPTQNFSSSKNILSDTATYSVGGTTVLQFDTDYQFAKLTDYAFTNDILVVSELFDQEKGYYMYMAQNAIDPRLTGNTAGTATLSFDATYTKAIVYRNGEGEVVTLANGVCTVELAAGETAFIVPIR